MLISRSRHSMGTLSCHKWSLLLLCLLLFRVSESVRVDYYNISILEDVEPSLYFDFDTNNSRLIVGATNQVFNLDLELTTKSNEVAYDTTATGEFLNCYNNGLDSKQCHNLHHLVWKTSGSGQITGDDNVTYTFDELVLMCSSHAYFPECIYRRTSDLQPVKTFRAKGFIPSETNPPLPALLLEDNSLITALDLNSFDRKILAKSTAPFLSTQSSVFGLTEENWFVEPNFVSIEVIGEYIYIFFREKAKEVQRNQYFSRVARICKSDVGALHDRRLTFTTFEKARITCDKGTHGTYFYNEIQDTYYDKEEQLLYAVFNSARYGPVGSAVCVYNFNQSKNDLNKVFDGTFFSQTGLNTLTPTQVTGNFGCQRSLTDALKYQFISNRTQSVNTTPLISEDSYVYHRMAPPISVNGHHVLFITASKQSVDGLYVMKFIKEQSAGTYSLYQETLLPDSMDTSYITNMVLIGTGADAHLFIGTINGIYRLPVHSCGDHTTCSSCVSSEDPYCTYDHNEEGCVGVVSSDSQEDVQEQRKATLCAPLKATTAESEQQLATTSKTTTEASKPLVPTVDASGLEGSPKDELKDNVWIIVGSVCGFVGGVILGVVISAVFRRYIVRRGKYRCSSVASSCELASGSRNNSATVAPLKLHSVIVNPTDSQQDQLMNNSMTSSKKFTRSCENDYSRPPDTSGSTDTCKKIPPSPPLKTYPSISPTKSSESDDSGIIGTAKCSDTGTPSPKVFSLTTPTKSAPQQTSCSKQPGAFFKFDPTSVELTSSSREACGVPAPRRSTDPNLVSEVSTVPRRGTDPNLKSNYRQNVHLTNQQRQNYGRNILARYPSIDGSKSKYLPTRDGSSVHGNGVHTPTDRRPPPPPVRPKPFPTTKTVVELEDVEGGSSQC